MSIKDDVSWSIAEFKELFSKIDELQDLIGDTRTIVFDHEDRIVDLEETENE